MTNPVEVTILDGEWTKVATAVQSGFVRLLNQSPANYLYTHRDTGDAAPTDKTEGAIFEGFSMEISSSVDIDVYIYAAGGGEVRVDL